MSWFNWSVGPSSLVLPWGNTKNWVWVHWRGLVVNSRQIYSRTSVEAARYNLKDAWLGCIDFWRCFKFAPTKKKRHNKRKTLKCHHTQTCIYPIKTLWTNVPYPLNSNRTTFNTQTSGDKLYHSVLLNHHRNEAQSSFILFIFFWGGGSSSRGPLYH